MCKNGFAKKLKKKIFLKTRSDAVENLCFYNFFIISCYIVTKMKRKSIVPSKYSAFSTYDELNYK